MTQKTVTIATNLDPDPLTCSPGDTVVFANQTSGVQTASSTDAGQTFTTGPIQAGSNSLPITVPSSTQYTVTPAGFQGSVVIGPAGSSAAQGGAMLSYATDIKPLFTAMDQDHMLNQVGLFDLWNYNDVKNNAADILNAVKSGSMPPSGSGEAPWTPGQVSTFQQWINQGCPP